MATMPMKRMAMRSSTRLRRALRAELLLLLDSGGEELLEGCAVPLLKKLHTVSIAYNVFQIFSFYTKWQLQIMLNLPPERELTEKGTWNKRYLSVT